MNLPADPLLAALRAVESARACLEIATARLNDAVIAQAEHAVPKTGTVVPTSGTVAPGLESRTHACCSREDATGIPECDEPPSRTL